MLTAATLGLAAYGLYSAGVGLADLFGLIGLPWWADLALVALGVVLTFSAVLVRVRIPGGLALAVGALLALQALSIYDDAHLHGTVPVAAQIVRGAVAAGLVALAIGGGRPRGGRSGTAGRSA